MTRQRFVSTEASPSGRPGPPVMEETKPCPSRPCYRLMESSSFCDLQGASCGIGTMRHNLTCLRVGSTALTDSSSEDMTRCQERLFGTSYSDDVCFISCPTDCVLSDWTSWSECQGPCVGTKTSEIVFSYLYYLTYKLCYLYMYRVFKQVWNFVFTPEQCPKNFAQDPISNLAEQAEHTKLYVWR